MRSVGEKFIPSFRWVLGPVFWLWSCKNSFSSLNFLISCLTTECPRVVDFCTFSCFLLILQTSVFVRFDPSSWILNMLFMVTTLPLYFKLVILLAVFYFMLHDPSVIWSLNKNKAEHYQQQGYLKWLWLTIKCYHKNICFLYLFLKKYVDWHEMRNYLYSTLRNNLFNSASSL